MSKYNKKKKGKEIFFLSAEGRIVVNVSLGRIYPLFCVLFFIDFFVPRGGCRFVYMYLYTRGNKVVDIVVHNGAVLLYIYTIIYTRTTLVDTQQFRISIKKKNTTVITSIPNVLSRVKNRFIKLYNIFTTYVLDVRDRLNLTSVVTIVALYAYIRYKYKIISYFR